MFYHIQLFSLLNQNNKNIQKQITDSINNLFSYGQTSFNLQIFDEPQLNCKTLYNYFDKIKICEINQEPKAIQEILALNNKKAEEIFSKPIQYRVFDMWQTRPRTIIDFVINDGKLYMGNEEQPRLRNRTNNFKEIGIDSFYDFVRKKIDSLFGNCSQIKIF
ncbi:hypothetical protein GVAV_002863 [Gurleya vavrai]